MTAKHPVVRFTRALYACAGAELTSATLLLIVVALTESAGIMLLVPLLHLAGVGDAGAPDRLESMVRSILEVLGVRPTLAVVLILYVVVVSVQALLQRAATVREYRVESAFAYALKMRLYRSLTYASWRTLVAARRADVAHALANESDRAGAAAAHVVYLISQSLLVVAYASLALAISPVLTSVTLVMAGIVLVLTRGSADAAGRAGEEVTRSLAAANVVTADHMSALKIARAQGLERRQQDVFRDVARRVSDAHRAAGAVFARVHVESTVASVAVLALLAYASLEILHMGAASLLVLLFLFSRLAPRISSARATWQMLRAEIPAYDFVENLASALLPALSLLPSSLPSSAQESEPSLAAPRPLRIGTVRLDDVAFAYDHASPVLRGVSLTIPARGIVAIAGRSGAGKTTLADIVSGLLVPDAGMVLVNDRRLDGEHLAHWRDSIAYVSQEPVLFDDTVRANLLWSRPDADDASLLRALAQANARALVESLPLGLETRLGDRGVRLSGGERQRIALARALLREPVLLILDEPTSSLDVQTERRMLCTLRKLARTTAVLLITHRVSALRYADVVYELKNGRLVERVLPARSMEALRT